jgi:hypothetical protein
MIAWLPWEVLLRNRTVAYAAVLFGISGRLVLRVTVTAKAFAERLAQARFSSFV